MQKKQGGWLHGALVFEKAVLFGDSFTDIYMPRFHKDPPALILFVLQTPNFTIHSLTTEGGIFISKQEKTHRNTALWDFN